MRGGGASRQRRREPSPRRCARPGRCLHAAVSNLSLAAQSPVSPGVDRPSSPERRFGGHAGEVVTAFGGTSPERLVETARRLAPPPHAARLAYVAQLSPRPDSGVHDRPSPLLSSAGPRLHAVSNDRALAIRSAGNVLILTLRTAPAKAVLRTFRGLRRGLSSPLTWPGPFHVLLGTVEGTAILS